MMWFRVDNRLIHGQVIETWLPYIGASRLVVCSAALAADPFRRQIMLLAVPSRITVDFCTLTALLDMYVADDPSRRTLVLFAGCDDARAAFDFGVSFTSLNIGNVHYAPGKTQVCAHVALSEKDAEHLAYLRDRGVALDFRCVPNDKTQVEALP
ncbi:PTS sugar transporter subunit IIB [Desulfovibrio sp. OttesenSCG-928-I05]|nr:PTS sugar transporter subunit IIB [Desulfovibrio sp. OttesenSCG-928-I05]